MKKSQFNNEFAEGGKSMDWWKEAVFYQIYPRSFMNSNNDGIGDLKGITSKLDYLSWLGVDAIWISPFFKSPMADFGYDISDYTAVDDIFGTLDDFKELLKSAHERRIKVIIDQVYNHTSIEHPWFVESRSSKNNPKADWYIWKDAKDDGGPPNNWVSLFSGAKPMSAWQWDEKRKQYYLHLFGKEQPDLNWRNPDVRREIFKAMKFWLEMGVDGFRFDAASHYYKDEKFRDALKGAQMKESLFHSARDVYYWDRFTARPETLLAVEEIKEFLKTYKPSRVSVGEISADMGLCLYLLFTLDGRFDMAFNLDFLEKFSLDAEKVKKLVKDVEWTFGQRAWPSYVLGNHDNSRLLTRVFERKEIAKKHKAKVAKLLAALLLTLRGTPFIYYGEEIAMEDTIVPYKEIKDPWGKTLWPKKGRDVCRTPMQWNAEKYAGFSKVRPWLTVNENFGKINVENQMKDENSVLHFYRNMLKLRKKHYALRRGKMEFWPSPNGVLFYTRTLASRRVGVILNMTDESQKIDLEVGTSVALGSDKKSGKRLESKFELSPFESLIVEFP